MSLPLPRPAVRLLTQRGDHHQAIGARRRGHEGRVRAGLWVLSGLCFGATLMPRPARAAECSSYDACEAQMLEANRAKDYPAAQRAAESAYRLRPDPNLLYNLGRFHQKQGHKAEAIDHYERFLASGDSSLTPELRQTIEGYLAELRRPQVSLPPPVLANAPTEEARLGWRFYTGVPLGVVGLGLIGVGAAVLAVDGKCTTNELPCPFRYNGNLGTGLGMLVPGVAVLGVGVTLSIMDVARRRKATLISSR